VGTWGKYGGQPAEREAPPQWPRGRRGESRACRGSKPHTTNKGNSRGSRKSGSLCSHSRGESIKLNQSARRVHLEPWLTSSTVTARQPLTSRTRETVADLGNRGHCVHIHTGNRSSLTMNARRVHPGPCMYRFGGTSTRAYTRTQQARGAMPELRRVADTTSHISPRLVRRKAFHTDHHRQP